jgi:hypothetical protein
MLLAWQKPRSAQMLRLKAVGCASRYVGNARDQFRDVGRALLSTLGADYNGVEQACPGIDYNDDERIFFPGARGHCNLSGAPGLCSAVRGDERAFSPWAGGDGNSSGAPGLGSPRSSALRSIKICLYFVA